MKTKILLIIATMLMSVSCELALIIDLGTVSGEPSDVFTATTECEQLTKTSLSSYPDNNGCYSLQWDSNDAISIFDGTNTAVYTTDDYYTSTADFVRKEGKISNSAAQYVAFYPSTITTKNMILPATQNYIDGDIENFPMRAVSDTKELEFKNLCGILRFSLKAEETMQVKIATISLSSDKGMSGDFTVGADDAAVVSGKDGVVLNCAEPKRLYSSSATDFNVIVPQGDYNPLKVKICDADGNEINLVSQSTVSVNRSGITRISLTLSKSTFESSLETIPITDADVEFVER